MDADGRGAYAARCQELVDSPDYHVTVLEGEYMSLEGLTSSNPQSHALCRKVRVHAAKAISRSERRVNEEPRPLPRRESPSLHTQRELCRHLPRLAIAAADAPGGNTPRRGASTHADSESGAVVAAGTLLVERKFIHGCGKVGHIEDVVVSHALRGHSLGRTCAPPASPRLSRCTKRRHLDRGRERKGRGGSATRMVLRIVAK